MELTGKVTRLKGIDTLPAGIAIVAEGTRLLDDEIVTFAPPAGAGPVSHAVPVAAVPPVNAPASKRTLFNVTVGAGTTVTDPCPEMKL